MRLVLNGALRVTLLLTVCLTVLMKFVIYLGQSGAHADPGWHFREGQVMTIVSALLLFGCARGLHQIWRARSGSSVFTWSNPSTLWRLLSISFIFLGFDELFRIHEALDRYSHKLLGFNPGGVSDMLDDLIVGAYGVIVLGFLIRFRAEGLQFKAAWPYFFIAGGLAGGHVAFDLISGSREILHLWYGEGVQIESAMQALTVFEEVLKIWAEVWLLGLVLRCKQELTQ